MSDIQAQIARLIDATIAGGASQHTGELAKQLAQSKTVELLQPITPPGPTRVTESHDSEDLNDHNVIDQLTRCFVDKGIDPRHVDQGLTALVDTGIIPEWMEADFEQSKHYEADADGEPLMEFVPHSAFMSYLDDLVPGASTVLLRMWDDSAGYDAEMGG